MRKHHIAMNHSQLGLFPSPWGSGPSRSWKYGSLNVQEGPFSAA